MAPRRPVPDIAAWFDLCVRPLVALAPGAQDGRRVPAGTAPTRAELDRLVERAAAPPRVALTWAARWLAGSVAGALAGAASLRR